MGSLLCYCGTIGLEALLVPKLWLTARDIFIIQRNTIVDIDTIRPKDLPFWSQLPSGNSHEKWDQKGCKTISIMPPMMIRGSCGNSIKNPHDIQIFDVASLYLGISDPKALELPQECVAADNCQFLSAWTVVRWM